MRFPKIPPLACVPALALALAVPARGQSFNIDFGPAASAPAAGYAAAGIAGTWNAIGVLPPLERAPLVDVTGQPSPARIYMFGGTTMMSVDDAKTSGDDEALLDDMLIGFCDPVDVCVWVENLAVGDYEVITYGLTPGDPGRVAPLRVDDGTPGPTDVGGEWPGTHVETATYARHLVTTATGRIGLHAGTYGGFFQAGINGVQIRKVGAVGVDPGAAEATRITRVTPNPATATQRVAFTLARAARGAVLEIRDPAGRIVRRIEVVDPAAGPHELPWDGRDTAGRRVAAGIYFARLTGTDASGASARLVRLR